MHADVPVNFGDSRLKSGRIIRLFVRLSPILGTFVQYLIAFCSRLEEAIDAISDIFIPPNPSEAAFLTVFRYNFRPEGENDVSGVAVDYVGMDVHSGSVDGLFNDAL